MALRGDDQRDGARLAGQRTRSARQLVRLERIADVVYALVIWRLFQLLPRPEEASWTSVPALLGANLEIFIVVALALAITIVYWLQSNELFGYLEGTDGLHTGMSIFQLFLVLFFLYAIGLGLQYEGHGGARAFESFAAFLVGAAAWLAWRYATGKRLMVEGADAAAVEQVSRRNLSEPLTALFTIPFAFAGPWLWELSWFLYPVLRAALSRRRGRSRD